MVVTDYEGLGTEGPPPYMLGKSEARGILDIVRTARQFHPELSDPFAIVGHSQHVSAVLTGPLVDQLKTTNGEDKVTYRP